MARKASGRPNGRPLINLDWEKIDKLLCAGCSGVEVASSISCHPNTLYERCLIETGLSFCDYLSQKKAVGNVLIKVRQFDLAMSGDKTMLIWLGKQRLGQTNKEQVEHTGELPIQVVNYGSADIAPWQRE